MEIILFLLFFQSFSPKTCPSEEYAVSRTLSEKITEFIRQECPEIVDDKDLTVLNYKVCLEIFPRCKTIHYPWASFESLSGLTKIFWRGKNKHVAEKMVQGVKYLQIGVVHF